MPFNSQSQAVESQVNECTLLVQKVEAVLPSVEKVDKEGSKAVSQAILSVGYLQENCKDSMELSEGSKVHLNNLPKVLAEDVTTHAAALPILASLRKFAEGRKQSWADVFARQCSAKLDETKSKVLAAYKVLHPVARGSKDGKNWYDSWGGGDHADLTQVLKFCSTTLEKQNLAAIDTKMQRIREAWLGGRVGCASLGVWVTSHHKHDARSWNGALPQRSPCHP